MGHSGLLPGLGTSSPLPSSVRGISCRPRRQGAGGEEAQSLVHGGLWAPHKWAHSVDVHHPSLGTYETPPPRKARTLAAGASHRWG